MTTAPHLSPGPGGQNNGISELEPTGWHTARSLLALLSSSPTLTARATGQSTGTTPTDGGAGDGQHPAEPTFPHQVVDPVAAAPQGLGRLVSPTTAPAPGSPQGEHPNDDRPADDLADVARADNERADDVFPHDRLDAAAGTGRPPPTPAPDAEGIDGFDLLEDVLAYVPTARSRPRSGRSRHMRRGLADLSPADQPFLPRLGAVGPLPAEPITFAHVNWRPRLRPFWVTFIVILGYSLWSFEPNRTPLGWVLTVVWSMPVIVTLVSLQGAFLLRRGIKRDALASTPESGVRDDTLIVVVPTIGRHDTYPALERVVRSFVEHLPDFFPRLRTDVVIEEGCEAGDRIHALATMHPSIRVLTVPRGYTTPKGTRFKARANHYAHEVRLHSGEGRDDVWVLHMDDDTAVGPDTAASLAQFLNAQREAGPDAKHLAQGILTYPRENAVNWLTWLADAVRPADDIARFRAVTGSGTPLAGLHGELLLVRASVEAGIGWDFGPKALVEDAQFALMFAKRHPGRSAWINGRCLGASPATVRDFMKQRERWIWGLIGLSLNRTIPWRHRIFMAWAVFTWMLSPLQHVVVVLIVATLLGMQSTSPVTQSITLIWSLNFSYTVWGYWEGLRLNRLASRERRRRWYEPIALILLLPVLGLIEAAGALRGVLKWATRRENTFVVIAKPA